MTTLRNSRSLLSTCLAQIAAMLLIGSFSNLTAATFGGQVIGPDDAALEGVSVIIYTGKPKVGPAVLCPYCYVDCGKQTVTGIDGSFQFNEVSEDLTFKLLLVKDGFLSSFSKALDPLAEASSLRMERLDIEGVPASHLIKGTVVAADGVSIVGATVSVEGWQTNDGGTTWGAPDRIMLTPMAITDSKGTFVLVSKEPLRKLNLEVQARGFAVREFYDIENRKGEITLELEEGGTVTGRVLNNGNPLAGIEMSISSRDRSVQSNFNRQLISTDQDGNFTFLNLPSGLDYYLTGTQESIKHLGTLPITTVLKLENRGIHNVGDLHVQEGVSIEGKIVIKGGGAIPANTVLIVGHEQVWEGVQVRIPADGYFQVNSLNPGEFTLSLRSPGHRFTARNRSYEGLNGGQLVAKIQTSQSGLIFELENEEPDWTAQRFVSGWPAHEMPGALPLSGVEPIPDKDLAARVRIEALDRKTGGKIPGATVTPGWTFMQQNKEPAWAPHLTVSADEDAWIDVVDRTGPASLRIAHPDYLESIVSVQNIYEETLKVSLERGQSLRGIVLNPDGTPASLAHVAHVGPVNWDHEMPTMHYRELGFQDDYHGKNIFTKCNQEGRFILPASKNPFNIMVAHPNGFCSQENVPSDENVTLQLKAWGSVKGLIEKHKTESDLLVQVKAERPELKNDFHAARGVLNAAKEIWSKLTGNQTKLGKKSVPFRLHFNRSYTINEKGEFEIPSLPPGRWWIVVSKKQPVILGPGGGGMTGAFTMEPLDAQEIVIQSGKKVSVKFAPLPVDKNPSTQPGMRVRINPPPQN